MKKRKVLAVVAVVVVLIGIAVYATIRPSRQRALEHEREKCELTQLDARYDVQPHVHGSRS